MFNVQFTADECRDISNIATRYTILEQVDNMDWHTTILKAANAGKNSIEYELCKFTFVDQAEAIMGSLRKTPIYKDLKEKFEEKGFKFDFALIHSSWVGVVVSWNN